MKIASITEYGGPDALAVLETPRPVARPHEAVIAVVASTINPVDLKTQAPDFPQEVGRFPATLGWDVAGIVVTAPTDSGWVPGDRVIAMHPPATDGSGSWQQYTAIPVELLAPAPTSTDLLTSATLPLASLTADQALHRLSLSEGEQLLVTGAAGSVGAMAVQLAAAAGITVTGLVSLPEHEEAALALGATVASSDPSTLGRFNAIFDTAGVFDHPTLLNVGGRLVTVSDDTIPIALEERASVAAHNYVHHDPNRLREFASLVDSGTITLRVAHQYPLADIRKAHVKATGGGLLGKIVLTM